MLLPARFAVFDLETTGVDVEQDRIVTAFAGVYDVEIDGWAEGHYWLLDPGVEIPDGAAAVHGYTTEDAQWAGSDAAEGVFSIAQRLDIFQRAGLPIAGYNVSFDFTLLDREQRRHYPGMRPFAPRAVLDGRILDKGCDPYRKGGRKLVEVAAHYGVPVEANAHDAAADCLMTARIVYRLMQHRQFRRRSITELHEYQVAAAAEQARSFAKYLISKGQDASDVSPYWPVRPIPTLKENA